MQWRLYLLGPPQLECDGKPIEVSLRKGFALLIFTSLTRRPHSRDALATLLWPDKDQQAARANLRRMLYELGQLLGDSFFDLTAERVTIHTGTSIWLDTEHFRRCLAESVLSPQPAAQVPAQDQDTASPALKQEPYADAARLARLTEAAELYTADFMAGFTLADCPEFDDWQFFQREELRHSFALLLGQLVSLHEEQARWEDALHYARRWLALDPLEEQVHRRLMQLYAHAGQPGAALRQYEECVRILAQELDAPPGEQTTALFTSIRAKRFPALGQIRRQVEEVQATSSAPARLPAVSVPSNTFPRYTTPFVGRSQELAEILRRLRDPNCRLLTIVGPGGMGKTRLAIEAAQLLPDAGPGTSFTVPQLKDGVYFVPLQPVSTPDRLIPVIADVLGLQFYESESPQLQLVHFLQEKELLLVLDNFEHLLEGADVVAEILADAPGVKLLITSREALKLQEEWFHPIAGMRLPHSTNQHQPSDLFASSDAAQLFIQAAHRALVAFEPQTQQEEITRICRLVDGIPLAIELAASWLKVLSCVEIAKEIERGMDILVTRHQNVAVRHRSMRVILDQSWQLLGEEAQHTLQRLSVFRGGFLQDAAAVVDAYLLMLAELVDKSWIYRTPDGRYQMHELLRQYAADKLAEAPTEEAEAQERHMAFYLGQVGRRESALTGPEQRAALDEMAGEIDNLQVAWTRAAWSRNASLINTALHALYLLFYMRSRYAEGKQIFAYALHHFESPAGGQDASEAAQLRCRLLARLGVFHLYLGELEAAHDCFSAVVDGSTSRHELAFVYARLGELARQQGNRPAAEVALHKGLSLARASGDRGLMAEALIVLSDISSSFADFTAGEQFAREGLALCRQVQRPDLMATVLASLAWSINCQGGYGESERYYRESLTISEAIANPFGIALATNFLGWVAFCEGGARLEEAAALHARALASWRHIGHRTNIAMCLGDCALVAYEQGAYAQAKHFAQEGLAIAEQLKHSDLTSYNLTVLGAAACGLEELAASRRYLFRSLQIAYQLHIPDNAALMLYFLAQLFILESKLAAPSDPQTAEKQLQALELLAFIIQHAATWQLARDRAQRAQADLMARLPVEAATAALARGRQRMFEEIVRPLLLEDQG